MKKQRSNPLPELGKCNVCQNTKGHIRFFVAVPLPEIMYLCQDDYNRLKEDARQFLHKLLGR